jgi:hypothetical protein
VACLKCVIMKPRRNEEAQAHIGLSSYRKKNHSDDDDNSNFNGNTWLKLGQNCPDQQGIRITGVWITSGSPRDHSMCMWAQWLVKDVFCLTTLGITKII